MTHSFDIGIATEYGVNEAIILNNLYFWVEHCRANGRNEHDGCYWTYNSTKALAELFPYMSEYQIRTALRHLESEGLIIIGKFNKSAYDHTLWYTVSQKGYTRLNKNEVVQKEENAAQDKSGFDWVDPAWLQVVRSYEANIGMMPTGRALQMLMSYVDDLTADVVIKAIEVTADAQPNNRWQYMKKILDRWAEVKVNTAEKAQQYIDNHKRWKEDQDKKTSEPPAITGNFY